MPQLGRMEGKGEASKKIWIVVSYFFGGAHIEKQRNVYVCMCIHLYTNQNLHLAHGLLAGLSVQSTMQILLTSFQG